MQSLWMLVATLMFSIMGVCVKLASESYSVAEIIMYRGFIGVIFIYILILQQGGSLRTHLIWQHLWRCVVGVTALWLWFCAIGLLPLATAMTLNYMAPIWISGILFIAAWRAGKRRFEWGLVLAITASFVGVTLLLRPSIHADQWLGGFLGLCSGALSALAYLQVRHLGQLGEPESRVVFYFSATGFIAICATAANTPMLSSSKMPFVECERNRLIDSPCRPGPNRQPARPAMNPVAEK